MSQPSIVFMYDTAAGPSIGSYLLIILYIHAQAPFNQGVVFTGCRIEYREIVF